MGAVLSFLHESFGLFGSTGCLKLALDVARQQVQVPLDSFAIGLAL